MKIFVYLKDIITGKSAIYEDEFANDYPLDAIEFMYSEGNYCCDCNRSLFLAKALGEEDLDLRCCDIDGKYRIFCEKIVTEDGTIIYEGDDEDPELWQS